MKKYLFLLVNGVAFSSYAQQNITETFSYQNINREYIAHLPAGYSSSIKYALYICLHGNTGSDAQIMDYTNLNNIADTGKFIAAYPQGYSNSWADGRGGRTTGSLQLPRFGRRPRDARRGIQGRGNRTRSTRAAGNRPRHSGQDFTWEAGDGGADRRRRRCERTHPA